MAQQNSLRTPRLPSIRASSVVERLKRVSLKC